MQAAQTKSVWAQDGVSTPVRAVVQSGRAAVTVAQIGAFGAAARRGKVLLVDGIHDLGGMQGLGAVDHSQAEPVFHHRWEAVARATRLTAAPGPAGNRARD